MQSCIREAYGDRVSERTSGQTSRGIRNPSHSRPVGLGQRAGRGGAHCRRHTELPTSLTAALLEPWWRAIALGASALLIALSLLALISMLARPLTLLFLAIVIAEALEPLVAWLQRRLPRTVAIIFVYLILLLVVTAIGLMVVPPLIDQAQAAMNRAPELTAQIQHSVERWDQLTLSLLPPDRSQATDAVLREIGETMGGYVRGLMIDAVILGGAAYVGLLIIGVNYHLVLALIAGLGGLIPIVGSTLAGAVMIGVALTQSLTKAIFVFAFYAGLQFFESNILLPNIIYRQAYVSPFLVIFALFAGSSIGGILGALVAIPLAGAIRVLVIQVIAPAIRHWSGAYAASPCTGYISKTYPISVSRYIDIACRFCYPIGVER